MENNILVKDITLELFNEIIGRAKNDENNPLSREAKRIVYRVTQPWKNKN